MVSISFSFFALYTKLQQGGVSLILAEREFHYTPTHASWLNQIELWFSILSRQVLRYGDFHTADDLVRTIEAFIRRSNRDQAKPFRWTYEGRPLVSE